MEEFILIKESWTKKDGLDFILYLEKIKMPRQNENQQKILATNMSCLGIYSKTLHEIANEIAKGNFLSFLDLWLFKYHENVIICGLLLNKIKDFITFKTYLERYAEKVDSWAGCDVLKINKALRNEITFNMLIDFTKSKHTFKRRIGFVCMFQFINEKYIDRILDACNNLKNEKEYYVNMAIAWLICECFIKFRDKTLEFYKNNQLLAFTINKSISKCNDSFRVSKEDKKLLLSFKK